MAQTDPERLATAYGFGPENGTPSLTAKDGSALVPTFDTTEADVIDNNRTRISEIEAVLQELGILA